MLVESLDQLGELLRPIIDDRVDGGRAAFDTETTEVFDDRFTPWGTTTRVAGFSISYDLNGSPVDFYACLRHEHYWDWDPERVRARESIARAKPSKGKGGLMEWQLTGEQWVELLDEEAAQAIPNLPLQAAYGELQAALDVATWYMHNAKFDYSMLLADEVRPPSFDRYHDTQFMSVFTDERPLDAWDEKRESVWEGEVSKGGYLHQGHGLKQLGETFLGVDPDAQRLLLEAREVLRCNSYAHLPLRRIIEPYACMDTRLTLDLGKHCEGREAWSDEAVRGCYERERRLLPRLIQWERRGFRRNIERAKVLEKQAEEKLARVTVETNAKAGTPLPFRSPKLRDVLYGDLEFPRYRDQSNTRQATLKHLRTRLRKSDDPADHVRADVIDGILEYRKVDKELSSFYRPFAAGDSERLHCILSQIAARTGRMSASKPNLQQSKKKGEVRKLLVPSEGHTLLFWDYSQIEMRLAAHYTNVLPDVFQYLFTWQCNNWRHGRCKGRGRHGKMGDRDSCRGIIHTSWRGFDYSYRPKVMGLYDGFMNDRGFDPHQRMFEVCQQRGVEEIDRDKSKTANFTILFGAGIPKLADTLDCSEQLSRRLFGFFWDEAYPELDRVKTFIGERLRKVGKASRWSGQDFVRTLAGRRYYLESSHKAMNYIIQGSAREILGDAMLEVCDYFDSIDYEYSVLLPVHDEIIAEVPTDQIDPEVVNRVSEIMMAAGHRCTVPMVVEPDYSHTSWGEKKVFDMGAFQ